MSQLVRAVDIGKKLIAWLPAQMSFLGWTGLGYADVLTTVRSVAVFRTGGTMRDLVTDQPTIVVETKGRTKTESMDMLLVIRSLIFALQDQDVDGTAIQQVGEFGGPAHLPADDSPTRATMTLTLAVSADVIG